MFKRYWKSLLIIGIIFFAIGTYYVQAKVEHLTFPVFKINTLNGDNTELDLINMYGHYDGENKSSKLTITKDSSSYISPKSIIGKLRDNFSSSIVADIQSRNRQFMRGKMIGQYNLFEDEQWVAHVDIPSGKVSDVPDYIIESLKIDILNKNTNKRSTFDYIIPASHHEDSMFLWDVHITNDQLFILTEHVRNNVDLVIHQFDIQEQEHMKSYNLHRLAQGVKESYTGPFHLIAVPMTDSSNSNQFLFTDKRSTEKMLMSFNYETKEVDEIDLPEGTSEDSLITVKDNIINLYEQHGEQIDVTAYDYVREKSNVFTFNPLGIANTDFHTEIINDKIYMYNVEKSNHHEAYLSVGSLITGEMLFEGKIEIDKRKPFSQYYLNITIQGVAH